jgi:hypothetical protein
MFQAGQHQSGKLLSGGLGSVHTSFSESGWLRIPAAKLAIT